MADVIAIRIDEPITNEGSAVTATVAFRDRATAAASTPSSIRYRVDCLTTKRAVVEWTSASAASTATITIPGTSNGIISDGDNFEERQLTVEIDTDLSTQARAAKTWKIRNIRTFDSLFEWPPGLPRLEPYFPITNAETSAGVTPTSYQYEPGDVRRYGAVGDGTTDDTTALQAALTVSRTHPMRLPPLGSDSLYYKITSELLIPGTGAQVIGAGYLSMIRQAAAGANVFSRAAGGSTIFSVTMRDVYVGVAGNITGGTGFNLEGIANSDFFNCRVIADHALQGLLIGFRCYTTSELGRYSYINEFHACRVRTAVSANARGYLFTGDAGLSSNSNHIFGGECRAEDGIGVYIPDSGGGANGVCNQNLISGVSFESGTEQAVHIEGSNNVDGGNVVAFCRLEDVVNGVLFDTGTVSNMAIGNLYSSGLTTKVVDNGEFNVIIEPSAQVTDANIATSRGSFRGKTPSSGAFGIFDAKTGTETTVAFAGSVIGDSEARVTIKDNGRMEWGSGSAAKDVSLHRTATAQLEVDIGFLKLTRAFFAQESAANIASIAASINTTGKFNGKTVWDTTNHRQMTTEGTTAGAPWYSADGSVTVTPA